MKRSISLRKQLFGLMALLVFLQSLALMFSLLISRVFLLLDAEAFRLFTNTTATRAQAYNTAVGSLVGDMVDVTETLSAQITSLTAEEGIEEAALYRNNEAYLRIAAQATQDLLSLIESHEVSGVFFMLNGSNAHKEMESAHSAVYLRNSSAGSQSADNFLLEIGPIAVSQELRIPASINWRLDMVIDDPGTDLYFHEPIAAALAQPRVEIERYGYWSAPTDILSDGQKVVAYTLPLLDGKGVPYGVVGAEISLPLFTKAYLPNFDLAYEGSFYSISHVREEQILLDFSIPSGPIAQVYLRQGTTLPLYEVPSMDVYETHVEGLGDMYCAVEPLSMYSRNSPYYDESWSLVSFAPKAALHETTAGIRKILIISIGVTTLFAFSAVFFMIYFTTRKISGLSAYVKALKPHQDIHFSQTGILEIDELTEAIDKMNRSVISASQTTSKILELTRMPLGGYEISVERPGVVVTDYVAQLLGLETGAEVGRDTWQALFDKLVAEPVEGYENIYHYIDADGAEHWLRILEAETETGRVGVVLDVSKDIEENRRLSHELDYDALTHLYSRSAFKREAFRMIREAPEAIGAMIFIDLDNLKYTNDTYGHDMGDRLIIRAGEIFRQFEVYGGVVSRISGDEFSIYLHGYASREQVKQRVLGLLSENAEQVLITPDGQHQRIRFSAGIAYYPADSDNVTDLLKLSDYAMYEAKHNQKGSIFEFNSESYHENLYLLENREAINLLLDEGLIRFLFQPIVDVKTGEIFAYEALMRPLLENFKSPLEILSVAAAQSKLGQLERLVMMVVFQTIQDYLPDFGNASIFINSIPSQALTDEDALMLERAYGELFPRVVIEITEAENNSPEQLQKKLEFVRRNGMRVAVDDFGSGYSNEIRVLAMEPDIIKVDIALISNIDTDKDKQKLLANLISFCQPKGIRIVAEGVERREELAQLIAMGVDFVQGYYIGRGGFEIEHIADKIKKEILFLQGRGKGMQP